MEEIGGKLVKGFSEKRLLLLSRGLHRFIEELSLTVGERLMSML